MIYFSARLYFNELRFFFGRENQVAAVRWLIAAPHFCDKAERFRATFDENGRHCREIRVDFFDGLRISVDEQELLLWIRCAAEAENDTMNLRFFYGFAVPAECLMCKVDVNAEAFIERLPDDGDELALCDGIC